MRVTAVILSVFALAGCAAQGGPTFLSAQSPPAAVSANSEPQPLGSFPAGAPNLSSAPNATLPNVAILTLGGF